ncbi:MAG: nickel pincer cofactor biosynthesis protein LarB [Nitrospiraceae bacterium]|nr:nickel pincer cofactor biosynthesis protein LarB [Nitrospiraceae bacterium]
MGAPEMGKKLDAFAELDHLRYNRIGIPEAIFAPGKSPSQVVTLAGEMLESDPGPVLVTRAARAQVAALLEVYPESWVHPDPVAFPDALASVVLRSAPSRTGIVGVITAGTTDIPVAEEAAATLRACGIPYQHVPDIGVAGLHRLLGKIGELRSFDVLIVAAGMEGALPSVLGGLVQNPVIAVPTSVGYGASAAGSTAMMSMLASCAPGVAVVGIDNGFGAACAAVRIVAGKAEKSGDGA